MKTRLFILIAFTYLVFNLPAQQLERRVQMKYANEPLGEVLTSISQEYDVTFAYSKDFIPVHKKVYLKLNNEPLSVALDDICVQTDITYARIGGQVVLKPNKKRPKISQVSKIDQKLPRRVKQTSPIYPEKRVEKDPFLAERIKRAQDTPFNPIGKKRVENLPGGNQMVELDLGKYKPIPIEEISSEEEDWEGDTRLAQVSLLPFLGTNALKSKKVTNNFSLNILWGSNGGVEGMEVGGFVNDVKKDVKGVQIAGLGNTVGGDVIGTQVSGMFNVGRGKMEGVQAAGLFNVSGETDAVQAAGIFNVSKAFSGVQASGFFNVAGGPADGVQAAGLFNTSKGHTKTQISGLFNIAGDVEWGQISTLINVGKKVKGFQIALINVADTISGTPIGLLNFIKKGYNKVEFGANDALFANFALKLGAKSFYNIFHIGARWDPLNRTVTDGQGNTQEINGTFMSWGLGYGIGTAITINPRTLMNIEAIAIHINEYEKWTDEMNLLNQLRFIFDIRVGRSTSLFLGPVGNVMLSERYDEDTGEFGSSIPQYTLYEETSGGLNIKMWAGFYAGIRF